MKKTESVAGRIKGFLEKVPGIQYAFIYGSFPGNSEDPEGAVDIMVLGAPDLAELDEIISRAEEELGTAIDVTSFTVREFEERIKAVDELVSKALKGPKRVLIGDDSVANQSLIPYNAP
jgi:predicted nucleotidyltransferase